MTNSQVSAGDIITPQKINEITVGTTAPTTGGLSTGSLWSDTSTNPPTLKYWTGSSWAAVTAQATNSLTYLGSMSASYAQDTSTSSVTFMSFSGMSPSTSKLLVAGSVRQTNTLTTQTYWLWSLRINASNSLAIVYAQINNQNPGTYFFVAEYGPIPSSGSSTHRYASLFLGQFIPDNTTVNTVQSIQYNASVTAWNSANWSSLWIYSHAANGTQAFFEFGPIHAWRLG